MSPKHPAFGDADSPAAPKTRPCQSVPVTTATSAVRTFFDPWNSSSTGHQRAENRLSRSTSWRASRNFKLSAQYQGGLRGGKHSVDTVGAGSKDFGYGGTKENGGWERGVKGPKTYKQKSLAELWVVSKSGKKSSQEKQIEPDEVRMDVVPSAQNGCTGSDQNDLHSIESSHEFHGSRPGQLPKQIFAGLCIYTNSSTAPLISDHKLKYMLSSHGARHSIALGRRSVTHVILGATSARGGAGGGLAACKIQKEIAQTGGKAVKFVTAEWVLESIKANRRLPEFRFSPLKLAPQGQNSVLSMLSTKNGFTGANSKT